MISWRTLQSVLSLVVLFLLTKFDPWTILSAAVVSLMLSADA